MFLAFMVLLAFLLLLGPAVVDIPSFPDVFMTVGVPSVVDISALA
jgi:hypothetical protein